MFSVVQSRAVTALTSTLAVPALARTEGLALLWAAEAITKGALEAETDIGLITGPRGRLIGGFSPTIAGLLREHGVRIAFASDSSRAVTLALQAAQSARGAVALVPNELLDDTMPELARAMRQPLNRGGSICVLLEDLPREQPSSCPRRAARRLGMPCIEAADVAGLRDAIDYALLLSRAGRCPCGLVVHSSVLRSADTMELRANRVGRVVEVLHARRRRRVRIGKIGEGGGGAGVLRLARRLELNRFRAMPSPGERAAVGFITVGPADAALLHLTHIFGLHGRVPLLQLQLIYPVDEAAVERMLSRCQQVIVLEPRPGTIEGDILAIAEQVRHGGGQPAQVWGRAVPPDEQGVRHALASDDDLHPSVLARKITHLLHAIRPSVRVASQLEPTPPEVAAPPARSVEVGSQAALEVVRRLLRDVDQWLRERAPLDEREIAPTALAIDGVEPGGKEVRIVLCETWDHRRFQRDGVQAVVQASRDDRPWMFIVCENAGEEIRDLERLARGAIPAERTDRVTLETANFNDLVALRDLLREATLNDRLTIVIVRDGPPPQYDASAIDGAMTEIDRLGFEPRQRLVQSVDEMCAIGVARGEDAEESGPHRGRTLRSEFTVEPVAERVAARFRLRVRPLLEEVEVVRVRPPTSRWRAEGSAKLPTPQAVHARQPSWRVHVAGFRGGAPGSAASALCEAGRAMGFHVRAIHDDSPIAPGRRAWAQVLFTRPRPDEAVEITAAIPYGEADLLLGLDPRETLRAIGPDPMLRVAGQSQTFAVANTGAFSGDRDFDSPQIQPHEIVAAVSEITRSDHRLLQDFAAACRRWFHIDRVADIAMLGAAYQLGLIPLSVEAMEHGLTAVEARGFGRCREAFDLGRRLAVEDELFTRREQNLAGEEPIVRLMRRLSLSLRHGGLGAAARSKQLAALLQQSVDQMPGLAETDAGRQARRDFVTACHRCVIWGGMEYAETYADLITRLYVVDRGDTGRSLTRNAVLPLAEAMLIRDPLYIAALAASSEHRRRVRERLHVKLARGDEVDRRYLTRIDLLLFSRRVRADVRTSDWPARFASLARRITPRRFRGLRRERQLRDFLIEFTRRAIVEAPNDYERWADAMQRLNTQAADDRLRGMAMAELKMLVGTL
jgi:hypothetical protein